MNSLPVNQPEDKPLNIMTLFEAALKADGSIDMRSTYGRSLRAIRDSLDADLNGSAEAFLKKDISTLVILEKTVESYLLSNPSSIISDKGLNPLITGDLMKLQEAKRRALTFLIDLKKKEKNKGKLNKNRDLNNICFE
ncbi:MAG: hypothetical protein WA081_19570 [Desulfosalsimonadaceae bacterium]